jgi:hypothetical protein
MVFYRETPGDDLMLGWCAVFQAGKSRRLANLAAS